MDLTMTEPKLQQLAVQTLRDRAFGLGGGLCSPSALLVLHVCVEKTYFPKVNGHDQHHWVYTFYITRKHSLHVQSCLYTTFPWLYLYLSLS